MNKLSHLALGIILLASSEVSQAASQLFGYFPNWDVYGRNYQPTKQDVPINDLTGIIYAFAQVGNCAPPYATEDNPAICNQGAYATGVQDYQLYSTDPYSDFNIIPQGYKLAGDNGKGTISKIIELAHQQKKPVLLSIGGWSLSTSLTTAIDPQHRAKFIASIISFLNEAKKDNKGESFDGVDIDWEPAGNDWSKLQPEKIQNFADFLTQLRAALKQYSASAMLTIASPAAPYSINAISKAGVWSQIVNDVDYINVMAYDYHGGFDNPKITDFHAPLNYDANQPNTISHAQDFNVETTLKAYLDAGVPTNKIILGFPAYGRAVSGVANQAPATFPNARGLYQIFQNVPAGEWGDGSGTYDYKYIVNNMLQQGFTEYEIGHDMTDFIGVAAYNSNNSTWISYDNVHSVQQKAMFTKQQQLAGIMVWELSGDISANDPNYLTKSLIHTAYDILK